MVLDLVIDALPLLDRAGGHLLRSLEAVRYPRGLVGLVGSFGVDRRAGGQPLCPPILRSIQHLLVRKIGAASAGLGRREVSGM